MLNVFTDEAFMNWTIFNSIRYSHIARICALLAVLVLIACGRPYSPDYYGTGDILDGKTQVGLASWYGDKEHGRKTASGERFNKNAFTAAHRTLPFGTVARVTNLENGRDVIVKINDRGPFVRGRIIDLSYGSARSIDLIRSGVSRVKVEVLSSPSDRSVGYFQPVYTVQVGSFSREANANSLRDELNSVIRDGIRVEQVEVRGDTFYRVRAGMFNSKNDADKLNRKLRSHGYRGTVIME